MQIRKHVLSRHRLSVFNTLIVDPSLVIITTYFVSRSMPWSRNNAVSLYDLYGHTLAQEPLPRGYDIYNFGRPFLGYHYYILSLFDLCLRIEKKIFKETLHFHYLSYMTTP